MGGAMQSRWGFLLPFFVLLLLGDPGTALAVSLDRLDEREQSLLRSTVKELDPLITDRKKAGTAPTLSFDELYAPLQPEQKAFLDAIRQVDPGILGGSSKKLPPPSAGQRFVRLDRQVVLRDGKLISLDVQYLPQEAYEAYIRMMHAMEADLGKRLLVESGHRSPAYQLYLFAFYMPKHACSIRQTNRFVALPGFSEHGAPSRQAIDFITPEGVNGEDRPEEFEELQEYGWLRTRAGEFGFYLSYPRGGPFAFEPWHWHWEPSE